MKICFVAQLIYPYLSNFHETKTAGGAELQQVFIGKGLKEKGFDVSYISMDYGQRDEKAIDGLKIFKTFTASEGLFGIRFFYPRLYKIWKALKRADADIYYVRCATFLPGVVAQFCRRNHRKFIYAGAHVTDFIPEQFRIPTKRDEMLYVYGLRRADKIIVQSHEQKQLLQKNFNLSSTIIPNFSPESQKKIKKNDRKYVLWVSTIRKWKRPEHFLELASQFPQERFLMIGGPSFGEDELYRTIEHRSKNIKNLKFLGYQPYTTTESYFDRCKIFVNTSVYEGFPNTFLQAWRRGIPVISYFDPDHVIEQNRLGTVISTRSGLKKALEDLLQHCIEYDSQISDYFLKKHSVRVMDSYAELFQGVLDIRH